VLFIKSVTALTPKSPIRSLEVDIRLGRGRCGYRAQVNYFATDVLEFCIAVVLNATINRFYSDNDPKRRSSREFSLMNIFKILHVSGLVFYNTNIFYVQYVENLNEEEEVCNF